MQFTLRHIKVSDLPESWRAGLSAAQDVRVTVRIEEETPVAHDDGPAFGMWRDRDDIADVADFMRRIRAPRFALID